MITATRDNHQVTRNASFFQLASFWPKKPLPITEPEAFKQIRTFVQSPTVQIISDPTPDINTTTTASVTADSKIQAQEFLELEFLSQKQRKDCFLDKKAIFSLFFRVKQQIIRQKLNQFKMQQ